MAHSGWGGQAARRVALVFGALAAVAGCATVLGIESDRHVGEALNEGGTPASDGGVDAVAEAQDEQPPTQPAGWACLNDPVPEAPDASVELQLTFNDVSGSSTGTGTGTPIAGADVHGCFALDILCGTPISPQVTDDAGIALMTLPGGFDGYYEVHASGYTDAVLSRTPMLASEQQDQGMANFTLLSAAGSLANVQQDPSLSIAILSAADCTTSVAAGIAFDVGSPGPNEQVVYLANNLPTTSATQTDSASGSALVFNVPAGTLTVSASFAASHEAIRTVSTIARQNWVTFVQIRPDQATRRPL